jgi:hypothetical protein
MIMFKNEKELVEKLVLDLQQLYDTQFIVRELRSGNSIADVVYTTSIKRDEILFSDYQVAYYYVREIYNKKNIDLNKVSISNTSIKRKFNNFLKALEIQGYIQIDGNYIKSIKKVNGVTNKFVAVEAKLSDWRGGLEQAIRYKNYADEVYVALSSEYIKNVSLDLFREHNIGLMSVSGKKLKIPLKARKNKSFDLDVQLYLADKFLNELKLKEIELV